MSSEPSVGEVVAGEVVEFQPNGALVRLAHGKVGFLHVSEIAEQPEERLKHELRAGQEILVKVIGYDRVGRPTLSLRRVRDQDREAMEFHREALEFRSILRSQSVALAPSDQPNPPGERLEWRLSRWMETTKATLGKLRRGQGARASQKTHLD